MRDHSQQAASAIARTKSDHTIADAKNSIPMRTARMTTAVMTRVRSKERYPIWVTGSPSVSCSLVRPKRRSRLR